MALMILGTLCSDSVDGNSSATKQALLTCGGARAILSCVHTEDPAVLLFACGALLNFGFRIFIMMGPLWVYKKFGWGAATYGFVTSGVGCFGIFVK